MSTEYFGKARKCPCREAAKLGTPCMAYCIGRSADYLKSRMGTTFVEGIHYTRPAGERDYFWDVPAVMRWVNATHNKTADAIFERVTGRAS